MNIMAFWRDENRSSTGRHCLDLLNKLLFKINRQNTAILYSHQDEKKLSSDFKIQITKAVIISCTRCFKLVINA